MSKYIVNTILGEMVSPFSYFDENKIPTVATDKTHYCDCLVVDPLGRFLILRRGKTTDFCPDKLCLPGGHLDPGETLRTCAKRELEEETGICCGEWVRYLMAHQNTDGSVTHYFLYMMPSNQRNDIVLDNSEHFGLSWMSLEEIKTSNSEDWLLGLNKRLTSGLLGKFLEGINIFNPEKYEYNQLTPEEEESESNLGNIRERIVSLFDKGIIRLSDFRSLLFAVNNEDELYKSSKMVRLRVDKDGVTTTKWIHPDQILDPEIAEGVNRKGRKGEMGEYPHSTEDLLEFARHASEDMLNKVIQTSSHPEEREVAAIELKRRREKEKVHEKKEEKEEKKIVVLKSQI